MTAELPRVRVTTAPNDYYRAHGSPDAVLLRFVDPCPWCGQRHEHGSHDGRLLADGTFGHRAPHCGGGHTHALKADGTRARVNRHNECLVDHPGYWLVPDTEE